ncbi:Fatty acid hydroxylase superfamily protein [Piscirickettsia salmonis]|uniref:Fatty acid hydroxylase superfamily protein n=3 Tax=Piscirickettsia salmonis TaxID=1238 RepID=A0A9Q6LVS3_PISSA|nr:fatty acid hydroxylase superfamily protein [Piscirickettsia salmonis]QGN78925.1 Fatty acid hydroxylase superfamily protein [Piscirickettsia salmonis]QGN82510.1 Fatty acid hydroxylase superfamily protein [Piscirickettsia salmonis]QGN86086.1 Fatty acid hydroxylase superfamily protein [Piscirickettsia salmonis]QGN89592.1 Fatty acid hydroxylase superfamily protein [Piscirickettsia salmonis]
MSIMEQFVSHYGHFIIIVWFTSLISLELITPNYASLKTKLSQLSRLIKHISFWLINQGVGLLITLPMIIWASTHALWQQTDVITLPIAVILGVVTLDLISYWYHRIAHITPLLWRFHEIHHLDEGLDVSTGLRVHFGEVIITGAIKALFIFLLGIPLEAAILFETLIVLQGIYHHSNFKTPNWLINTLSLVITTPKQHATHHHALQKDTDSNYGFIFIWWDKLFFSFNLAQRKKNWRIGLEYSKDLSLFALLISPFHLKPLKERVASDTNTDADSKRETSL